MNNQGWGRASDLVSVSRAEDVRGERDGQKFKLREAAAVCWCRDRELGRLLLFTAALLSVSVSWYLV